MNLTEAQVHSLIVKQYIRVLFYDWTDKYALDDGIIKIITNYAAYNKNIFINNPFDRLWMDLRLTNQFAIDKEEIEIMAILQSRNILLSCQKSCNHKFEYVFLCLIII